MPWSALPFSDRERKQKLSEHFGVRGIPMLVVLNGADGKLVAENGRNEVQSTKDFGKSLVSWGLADASATKLADSAPEKSIAPWGEQLFGKYLLTKTGQRETKDVLNGKRAVLVYCSAHWCPPCRGFTPVLAQAYKNYNGGDVEVVFVSSDQGDKEFNEYFK